MKDEEKTLLGMLTIVMGACALLLLGMGIWAFISAPIKTIVILLTVLGLVYIFYICGKHLGQWIYRDE